MKYINALRNEENQVKYIVFDLKDQFSDVLNPIECSLLYLMSNLIESRVSFFSCNYKDYIFTMNDIVFNSYDYEELISFHLINRVTLEHILHLKECIEQYFKKYDVETVIYSIHLNIAFNKLLNFMEELIEYEV